MTLVRLGSDGGSDVYVYEDCSVGLCCCGCNLVGLVDPSGLGLALDDPGACFNGCSWTSGRDAEAMAGHLKRHEGIGDMVPAVVYERLMAWALEVLEERRPVPVAPMSGRWRV